MQIQDLYDSPLKVANGPQGTDQRETQDLDSPVVPFPRLPKASQGFPRLPKASKLTEKSQSHRPAGPVLGKGDEQTKQQPQKTTIHTLHMNIYYHKSMTLITCFPMFFLYIGKLANKDVYICIYLIKSSTKHHDNIIENQ